MTHEEQFLFGSAVRHLIGCGITDTQVEVWAEEGNPLADYGTTAKALSEDFENFKGVYVHECTDGDLFVTALNHGIRAQYDRGVTHSLILSSQVSKCITPWLLEEMERAVTEGAKVVTVGIDEIAELVDRGMACNSCALWDLDAFIDAGGFNPRDTKPKGNADHYLRQMLELSGYTFADLESTLLPFNPR